MELVIYSPKQDQFIKAIEFNFDELRQEMSARLERYNGLVYTDAAIREAKTDRAALNKFKEAIENKRREIKKECLAPYEDFEKKIKQLTALIDAPIQAIDSQIKAYEQAQKDEKRTNILEEYMARCGNEEFYSLLPFERVFNEKWLNVTYKLKDIFAEIQELISRVKADLQTISDLHSEHETQIKDTYLRTLDLSAALNEKTRLEQQKAKLAEYEARRAVEVHKAPPPDFSKLRPGDTVDFSGAEETAFDHLAPAAEPVLEVDFRVWATRQQLGALKAFLISNHIKYGKVE